MASRTGEKHALPVGFHTLTPYLTVVDPAAAIQFYVRAFDARELYRLTDDTDRIVHAEIEIGDSRLMLSGEVPQARIYGPLHYGGTPIQIHLYVQDVDAVHARALSAGAQEIKKLVDQPYGDRSSTVVDPFGHHWILATQFEDVSPEEMKRRMGLK